MESLAAKKLANKERVINILLSRIAKLEYEVENLNNIIKTLDDGFKASTDDLCETAKELEIATNRIKMALDYIKDSKGQDINYVATLLLGFPTEIEEMRKQLLTVIGSDNND